MSLEDKIRSLLDTIGMLHKDEIDIIVEKTIVEAFEKGTVLLREGQVQKRCYMVIEGTVREYLLKDGEEKSTAFFMKGDSFTPPLKNGKPSPHYWECTEDCVLTISNQKFENEIREAVPRLDAVFQQLAIAKMNQAKEEWSQFISSSPEERYLNLIATRPILFEKVPHHQIASYLGMAPQSLSRIRKRIIEKES